jgi:hypothetical protein
LFQKQYIEELRRYGRAFQEHFGDTLSTFCSERHIWGGIEPGVLEQVHVRALHRFTRRKSEGVVQEKEKEGSFLCQTQLFRDYVRSVSGEAGLVSILPSTSRSIK